MTISPADLHLDNYDYELPAELIAHRPCQPRDHSRLLVARESQNIHAHFFQLAEYLPEKSCIVLNESKVFSCRFFANKVSGAKVEIFLLTANPRKDGLFPAMIKSSRKKKIGDRYFLQDICFEICEHDTDAFWVKIEHPLSSHRELLENFGQVPIPHYIREGRSDAEDFESYQTVFAKNIGSVAAPTAGLHFTQRVFDQLREKNISIAKVTLHVGMGTFAPVKSAVITDHQMHSENFFIEENELIKINSHTNRLFAVGTTSLRCLESCSDQAGRIHFQGNDFRQTNIFLHPGKKIHSIRGLITNFHLPKSSLIMLVSALIGREEVLSLYQEAIANKYRFYSYGDAMLVDRKSYEGYL